MNNGWVGVDLDGTLAEYNGWVGPNHIGEPVPKMVERVRRWLSKGITVKIFTARVGPRQDVNEVIASTIAIKSWCAKHIGTVLDITCEKDYSMIELWDDRAVQVIKNTGERADGLGDDDV
jgi:hypothetical protein